MRTPETARDAPAGEAGVTLVELLIAVVILAVGLLGVAGMAGAVAMQTRMAGSVTGQTAAGQEVLEELQMKGYDHSELATGSSGTRQVKMSSFTYTVNYSVSSAGTDLKEIVAVVDGTQSLPPDTMRTYVYDAASSPPPIP